MKDLNIKHAANGEYKGINTPNAMCIKKKCVQKFQYNSIDGKFYTKKYFSVQNCLTLKSNNLIRFNKI